MRDLKTAMVDNKEDFEERENPMNIGKISLQSHQ